MSKKANSGIYTAKVEANKTHKSIMGSLNKLQKIALEYYEGKENPAFKKMCDQLGLVKSDIQFKHVISFGTNRELNFLTKAGELKGKKTVFSFWLFESCLIRYANQKQAAKTVKIEQKAPKSGEATKEQKVA